jgi:lipopolysaccharide/colanic/teichoic acid biosynthesis glycosyltransferase
MRIRKTMIELDVSPNGGGGLYKRPLDLGILVLAHVFLFPVWACVWALIPFLIWLEDRGPIFYRQPRVGKHEKVFSILKFRTLVPNADQIVRPWEVPNGPVVTRMGKLLRATALDELPQVLNILKGDMSFVGPRAMPLDEYEKFVKKLPELEYRLLATPGLTGLAQVYGKATRDIRNKLRYDLLYIRRMSLWLDVKLVLLSVWITLRGKWESRPGSGEAARRTTGQRTTGPLTTDHSHDVRREG